MNSSCMNCMTACSACRYGKMSNRDDHVVESKVWLTWSRSMPWSTHLSLVYRHIHRCGLRRLLCTHTAASRDVWVQIWCQWLAPSRRQTQVTVWANRFDLTYPYCTMPLHRAKQGDREQRPKSIQIPDVQRPFFIFLLNNGFSVVVFFSIPMINLHFIQARHDLYNWHKSNKSHQDCHLYMTRWNMCLNDSITLSSSLRIHSLLSLMSHIFTFWNTVK